MFYFILFIFYFFNASANFQANISANFQAYISANFQANISAIFLIFFYYYYNFCFIFFISAIRSIIDADMARQQRVHGIFKDFYVIQNRFSCSAHQ